MTKIAKHIFFTVWESLDEFVQCSFCDRERDASQEKKSKLTGTGFISLKTGLKNNITNDSQNAIIRWYWKSRYNSNFI